MTKTPSPHHPITETRPHPVHWPSRGSDFSPTTERASGRPAPGKTLGDLVLGRFGISFCVIKHGWEIPEMAIEMEKSSRNDGIFRVQTPLLDFEKPWVLGRL